MELVRINATLSKQVLERIDHYANEMQEDRSTAIRQLLLKAIIELEKGKIIKAYKEKKLTIREAAEALGIDYWEMQKILEEMDIAVTDLTMAEINERKKQIKNL